MFPFLHTLQSYGQYFGCTISCLWSSIRHSLTSLPFIAFNLHRCWFFLIITLQIIDRAYFYNRRLQAHHQCSTNAVQDKHFTTFLGPEEKKGTICYGKLLITKECLHHSGLSFIISWYYAYFMWNSLLVVSISTTQFKGPYLPVTLDFYENHISCELHLKVLKKFSVFCQCKITSCKLDETAVTQTRTSSVENKQQHQLSNTNTLQLLSQC